MEFDHMTNRYLYPDRYNKMIPYFLNNQIVILNDYSLTIRLHDNSEAYFSFGSAVFSFDGEFTREETLSFSS
jgi:hypothetical protein